MCRLFGFRSQIAARVHPSLVLEKNSLRVQSVEHKDGWGIAAYTDAPTPRVAHGLGPAHQDPEFERVSGLLNAHTVLAHVRLASVGIVHLRNAHPFVHGRWSFAHNGTVTNYAQHQQAIEALLPADLRTLLQGDTDSERCFMLFLSHLRQTADVNGPVDVNLVARALAKTTADIARLTDSTEKPSSMNFMATDGELLVATRRHRTLHFSEQRKRHGPGGTPPVPGTRLDQIVIASEMLSGEDHWHEVPEGEVVGVNPKLELHRWKTADLLKAE